MSSNVRQNKKMGSTNLTDKEQKIVGSCLRAAADGPFFPDWEFQTLFGLTRPEVKAIADRYPDVDKEDDEPAGNDDSWLAINNTFANLLGYPHRQEPTWSSWIDVSPAEVEQIFKKWRH